MFKKILMLLAMLATSLAMAAVDVNKATEAELDSVKGIGPGTSKAILDERKKGNFKSWEDFISRVKGVGESRASNLSEAGLRVNGRTFQATAAKKDDAKAADSKAAKKEEAKAPKKDEAKAEKKEAKAEAARPAAAASAKK